MGQLEDVWQIISHLNHVQYIKYNVV